MSTISRREVLRMAAMAGVTGLVTGRLIKTTRASDAYSGVVLSKGPVGYWRLGETAGPTAVDSSGFGYHGTYQGNPTFGQPGAIVNDADTAIGCNGPDSKDYIEIPDPGDSAVFSQPTSSLGFTVEAWMRPDTLVFPVQPSGPDFYIHWLGKCASGSGQCEWGLRFYNKDFQVRSNRISAYIWNPGDREGTGAYFQDDLTDVVGTIGCISLRSMSRETRTPREQACASTGTVSSGGDRLVRGRSTATTASYRFTELSRCAWARAMPQRPGARPSAI